MRRQGAREQGVAPLRRLDPAVDLGLPAPRKHYPPWFGGGRLSLARPTVAVTLLFLVVTPPYR